MIIDDNRSAAKLCADAWRADTVFMCAQRRSILKQYIGAVFFFPLFHFVCTFIYLVAISFGCNLIPGRRVMGVQKSEESGSFLIVQKVETEKARVSTLFNTFRNYWTASSYYLLCHRRLMVRFACRGQPMTRLSSNTTNDEEDCNIKLQSTRRSFLTYDFLHDYRRFASAKRCVCVQQNSENRWKSGEDRK